MNPDTLAPGWIEVCAHTRFYKVRDDLYWVFFLRSPTKISWRILCRIRPARSTNMSWWFDYLDSLHWELVVDTPQEIAASWDLLCQDPLAFVTERIL